MVFIYTKIYYNVRLTRWNKIIGFIKEYIFMWNSTYSGTKTPLVFRLIAAFGAVGVVTGVGLLLSMKNDPVMVEIQPEQSVFVSLIDEPAVQEAPKGEQTDTLPAPPEEQAEPESMPEPEPQVEPEPEPELNPEPAPVVESSPKPKPKPKPKPQPKPPKPKPVKSQEVTKPAKQFNANATTTKAFGIPDGKPNAPAGRSLNKGPVRVTSVNYVVKPKPVMPRSSSLRGERGLVIVRVVISIDGSVKEAFIQKSTPYEALNREALRAVKRARFRPYSENGVPRESMADIPINFK